MPVVWWSGATARLSGLHTPVETSTPPYSPPEIEENGKLKLNQFSKKNFEMFLTACANDTDFKSEIVHSVNGEITEKEALPVTTMFRDWLRKVVEEAGVDKAESEKILSPEFEIPAVKGLYDFFVAAMYDYMRAGNYFQFPDKEDFKGKLDRKSACRERV